MRTPTASRSCSSSSGKKIKLALSSKAWRAAPSWLMRRISPATLVNAPSNELTPTELAARAQAMAEELGLECEVLDRDAMAELGMGALLGVAKGSAEEPKLVFLRYRGSDDAPIALVGKGVTFDTGGISLKPAAGMGAMTNDMAGAAAVLGAMRAIAQLKPNKHVIAVAACVENMPSGTAQKPGDVVRAMTGKTIEIDNTRRGRPPDFG